MAHASARVDVPTAPSNRHRAHVQDLGDRIETAEERKDWILVLDLADGRDRPGSAEEDQDSHMDRAGDACLLAGSVHSCKHDMCKSCFTGDDAPRGCSMYTGFVLLMSARSGDNGFVCLNTEKLTRSRHSKD